MGKVQSVVDEVGIVQEGRVTERAKDQTRACDANGRMIRWTKHARVSATYGMVSPAHGDFTYSYDHRGQLMQIGDAVGRSTRYKRDASGRIVEVDLLREDGRLSGKHVLHYGSGNRPTEQQVYDRDGDLSGRLKFRYDALGRRIETVDQLGFVEKTTRYTYDARGNLATMEEINPIGSTLWVYSYESIDSEGNWTKRAKGQEAVKFGKKVVVPVEVTYRTLTYHK